MLKRDIHAMQYFTVCANSNGTLGGNLRARDSIVENQRLSGRLLPSDDKFFMAFRTFTYCTTQVTITALKPIDALQKPIPCRSGSKMTTGPKREEAEISTPSTNLRQLATSAWASSKSQHLKRTRHSERLFGSNCGYQTIEPLAIFLDKCILSLSSIIYPTSVFGNTDSVSEILALPVELSNRCNIKCPPEAQPPFDRHSLSLSIGSLSISKFQASAKVPWTSK